MGVGNANDKVGMTCDIQRALSPQINLMNVMVHCPHLDPAQTDDVMVKREIKVLTGTQVLSETEPKCDLPK